MPAQSTLRTNLRKVKAPLHLAQKLQRKVVNNNKKRIRRFRHRHIDRFVFIHINKTGGSSIERALKLAFEHKTALQKIEEIGKTSWDQRYTFAVVRNPWDKVVSHYHHRVHRNRTNLATNPISFHEWVKLTYGEKDAFYYDNPQMFMPQFDWITDDEGNILVDFICRFENLKNDFDTVCETLNVRSSLPHLKASKRGRYNDYYDSETANIVSRWFKKDIDYFDYSF